MDCILEISCSGSCGHHYTEIGWKEIDSQMTVPQLAVLISIGTIIGLEVSGKGLAASILAAGTFVGFLAVIEWITLKWNAAETVIRCKSVPVIANGINQAEAAFNRG
ncbi:hypothetical protein [Weizmannia acidilactici]|uniref:hypothetical protein n=1 Tax=Weizmannia acidilactici TaxID=2607726 RepID=UPI00124C4805|nr:hypothetical protein [Weizmannia acidilactici]GER72566.1 hypothetical protein BpPP18_06330 [Weizmannia acidilactici]